VQFHERAVFRDELKPGALKRAPRQGQGLLTTVNQLTEQPASQQLESKPSSVDAKTSNVINPPKKKVFGKVLVGPNNLNKGDVIDFKSAQDKKAKDAGYFDHKTKMTIDASKKDPELNSLLHTPLGQHPSDSDYSEQKPKVKQTKEEVHARMNAKINKPKSTDEKIANAMALQNQPKPKQFGKITLSAKLHALDAELKDKK
jgi:hypothetical protein